MKSERRHELQHNELAEWLAKSVASIRPYQNMILTAVVVFLVAALGYTLWSHEVASRSSQAWDEFNTALGSRDTAKIAKIIEQYPNTAVGNIAAIMAADGHLSEGCDRLFVNKAIATQELTKAGELYRAVREQATLPWLLERATYGLGRAEEAKGNLEPAKALYEEIAEKWPNGTFATAASQRLQDLKRPATKRFYDDFAHFDPKPAFSGKTGEPPAFDLNSLPNEGPSSVSDLKLDTKEKSSDKKPVEQKKPPEKAGKK